MNLAFLCISPETGNWHVATFNLTNGKLPDRKLNSNILNNKKQHVGGTIVPKYLFRLKRINSLFICLYLLFGTKKATIKNYLDCGLTTRFANSNFNTFISAKTISAIFLAPNALKCVISSSPLG